ncbi:MAG: hypothetical protein ACREFQ_13635, partial [Stellaceae bacterium]
FEDDADDVFGEWEGEPEYDPETAPDEAAWLARDEDERLLIVEAYHRRAGIEPPKPTLHATIHAIVENQIAAGDETPVRETVARLMREGLGRHDAIHAVGHALIYHMHDLLQKRDAPADAARENAAYFAAVTALTAEAWLRMADEDDEDAS